MHSKIPGRGSSSMLRIATIACSLLSSAVSPSTRDVSRRAGAPTVGFSLTCLSLNLPETGWHPNAVGPRQRLSLRCTLDRRRLAATPSRQRRAKAHKRPFDIRPVGMDKGCRPAPSARAICPGMFGKSSQAFFPPLSYGLTCKIDACSSADAGVGGKCE
jgi:hypothetical protein